MKKWKQLIAAVLTLAMLVTIMPGENVRAASKTPAKLSAKDFVSTDGVKEFDFLEQSESDTWAYSWICKKTDTKGAKDTDKTNRNVKLGSTEAFVKKSMETRPMSKLTKRISFINRCYTDTLR